MSDTDIASSSVDPVTDIELIGRSIRLSLNIGSDDDIIATRRDT